MNHEPFEDMMAAYALGELTAGERGRLTEHLNSGCAECRKALADYGLAAAALTLAATPETPPAHIKEALMNRIEPATTSVSWMPRLALAAGLLVAVGGAWLGARHSFGPRWEVAALSGAVQADGKTLSAGGRVRKGQVLTVAGDGWADLRLGENAVVRLKNGAEASLARGREGLEVVLKKGGLFSLVKPGTKFSVRAPLAVASVRGTAFYMQVDSPDKTYACICKGRFHLAGAGIDQDMQADHHHAMELSSAGPGPGTMRDHTDEEMNALQAFLP